eukprot:TRINITY_DN90310_c0_g1_i1.p1 TRINITY_DN90310_c0_g1~~TRINITY_DN90310_c0_g1_i1.p1  ORF type:complete len:717 (-),score=132.47 TRINITY_DN90310_c0_g1_i1:200-2350(-)
MGTHAHMHDNLMVSICSETRGTVREFCRKVGESFKTDDILAYVEAMKMFLEVRAQFDGVVDSLLLSEGQIVEVGQELIVARRGGHSKVSSSLEAGSGFENVSMEGPATPERADLQLLRERLSFTADATRSQFFEKRKKERNQRSARELVLDLCDAGTFDEYGALAVAAQSSRRNIDDLRQRTPADGMLSGVGKVAGITVVVIAYDYSVLAGTQGFWNHRKLDRMLAVARKLRAPVVLFAEGGGGRPGDTDVEPVSIAGLNVPGFSLLASLKGQVPLIGVCAGICFAGNAALLGMCDVIIATTSSNIGMGGPAMIEGGGLGVFRPEVIGPVDTCQSSNGVVDIVVNNDVEAVQVAKDCLAVATGQLNTTSTATSSTPPSWHDAFGSTPWPSDYIRHCTRKTLSWQDLVPENRLAMYDVYRVVDAVADPGSFLELQPDFASGMITGFVRIRGRPVAVLANNNKYLGGAIDADCARKAAAFLRLCQRWSCMLEQSFGKRHGQQTDSLPVLSLCDTPGFMVGPEAEKGALVRAAGDLFVEGARVVSENRLLTIVLRKCYGLGGMAMCGGGTAEGLGCIAWPSAEFGGMGLEGAVRLGFRKELAEARSRSQQSEGELFDKLVAALYDRGRAVNAARFLEIDAVIEPAATTRTVCRLLLGVDDGAEAFQTTEAMSPSKEGLHATDGFKETELSAGFVSETSQVTNKALQEAAELYAMRASRL